MAPAQKLDHEAEYLHALPSAEMYERSYMHRDVVTHVVVAAEVDFIATGSADGHVKLWKKRPQGVEFAKHFRAHLGPVEGALAAPLPACMRSHANSLWAHHACMAVTILLIMLLQGDQRWHAGCMPGACGERGEGWGLWAVACTHACCRAGGERGEGGMKGSRMHAACCVHAERGGKVGMKGSRMHACVLQGWR